jgi:hypothetical protein
MSKKTSQPVRPTKVERRRERREEMRRREEERLRAARRKRMITIGGIIAVIVVVLVAVGAFVLRGNGQQTNTASTANSANPQAYPPVDNIVCQANEQLTYHIHAHLTIYINGKQVAVPSQVGIPTDGSCFYWLHTHDNSGIIHIETPGQGNYTLGTFLHLWGRVFPDLQPSFPVELDQTSGWQVYVDGKPYNGDFHNIQLTSHELITMAYNSPGITPDTQYNWPDGY